MLFACDNRSGFFREQAKPTFYQLLYLIFGAPEVSSLEVHNVSIIDIIFAPLFCYISMNNSSHKQPQV